MLERIDKSEKSCDRCGKAFIMPSAEWAYKKYKGRSMLYFCSWKCLREWEKIKDLTKAERRERIIQALSDGMSIREVSTMLDEDPAKVYYWKRRINRGNI